MTTRAQSLDLEASPTIDRDRATGPLGESGVRTDQNGSTAPTLLAASTPPEARSDANRSQPALGGGLAPGEMLDGVYRVEKLIGRGAMGAVYLVEHLGLGRRFAAKVVAIEHASTPDLVHRLRNEARIASQVQHENIVDVTHLGQTADGALFIVMELLEGCDLRDWMYDRRDAPIPFDDVRRVAADVMAGLAAAHDAGIVHRDLKPDNVFLVERQGRTRAKLVDFGISKSSHSHEDLNLTRTGQIMGTPLYMAPEQTRSTSDVDARADQYALGVMLYELLAGRLPFVAGNLWDVIVKHATAAPDPLLAARPDTPLAVEAVVLRCLAKQPGDRFESVHAVRAAWDAAWSAPAVTVTVGSPPTPDAAAPAQTALAASDSGSAARDLEPPRAPTDPRVSTAASQPAAPAASTPAASTPAAIRAAAIAPAPSSAARPSRVLPVGLALAVLVGAPLAYLALHQSPTATPPALVALDHPTTPLPAQPRAPGPPHAEPPPHTEPPPHADATPTAAPSPTADALTQRTLHTTPEGATVRIGDADVGTTPYALAFRAGSPITVDLRLRGYRRETRTLTLDDAEPLAIPLRRAAQERRPELAPR